MCNASICCCFEALFKFLMMTSAIALPVLSASENNDSPNVWVISGNENWPAELGSFPKWMEENQTANRLINSYIHHDQPVLVVFVSPSQDYVGVEKIRKQGAEVVAHARKSGWSGIVLQSCGVTNPDLLAFVEGSSLASYQFLTYKTGEKQTLSEIVVSGSAISEKEMQDLRITLEGVALTRDLVNEPAGYLTAEKLSEVFVATGQKAGFAVEVLEKNKIEALKMGGLLGVNQGSDLPPTFNVMEYKPQSPKNTQPIVLVGKGVVYDTGGHSLKTSAGMEYMKCDMAGSATVLGILRIVAGLQLPLHVIGLVPATDNRISAAALSPGDVITISNGTTVEVLNTDAEGRLILADALVFAQKYKPEVVFDFATLTGAAARAIGKEGFVHMGTAGQGVKDKLTAAQQATYERGVEFPLWDEYDDQLKSDVADVKNIGGAEAGAITAGKFLQRFTDYPWIHFDIAGPAFYEGGAVGYIPKGGTAFGVRMVVDFLKNY